MSLERDAAAAQALLHAIIGDGADAIFVKDRDLRYVVCNEAAERLAGLSFADIVGKTVHDILLAAAIRAKRPSVRVLYMSGYADEEMPRSGPPSSGNRVLAKPFPAEVLGRAVREVLGAVP